MSGSVQRLLTIALIATVVLMPLVGLGAADYTAPDGYTAGNVVLDSSTDFSSNESSVSYSDRVLYENSLLKLSSNSSEVGGYSSVSMDWNESQPPERVRLNVTQTGSEGAWIRVEATDAGMGMQAVEQNITSTGVTTVDLTGIDVSIADLRFIVEDRSGDASQTSTHIDYIAAEYQTNQNSSVSVDNATTTVNTTIDFSNLVTASDSDGNISQFELDADGDGTIDKTVSNVSNLTYTYSSTGNFSAEVTVTDDDGATSTDTASITVEETSSGGGSTGGDGSTLNLNDVTEEQWMLIGLVTALLAGAVYLKRGDE